MSSGKLPHCAGCPLEHAPGPVWGEGSRETAQLVYIGQNPGQQEVLNRRPFVGPSGNVLNRQLWEAGVRRENLYITNVVKCLTPDNRLPTDAEIRHCRPILDAELARCKADTIILSGALAFTEMVGDYSTILTTYHPTPSIHSRRGCVEVKDGKKLIGTIHPAAIMRMPEFRLAASDDIRKAASIAGKPIPPPSLNLSPTTDEVRDYIHYIQHETKAFSDDFETSQRDVGDEDDYVGGDYAVDMCGLSADGQSALVLTPDQLPLLRGLLVDPTVTRIEHNRAYEAYHWEHLFPDLISLYPDEVQPFGGCPLRNLLTDTMIDMQYLRSHEKKYLKPNAVAGYTTLPYYDRKLEQVDRKVYNAYDVLATWQAWRTMQRKLESWKLTELCERFGQQAVPLMEEIRRVGCRVDIDKALLIRRFCEWRIGLAKEMLSDLAGPTFNINSPKQIKEFLYEKWSLPVQYNNADEGGKKVQKVTTDEDARQRLKRWIKEQKDPSAYDVPWKVMTLIDYISGEEGKIDVLKRISPDGRLHPYFKMHGQQFYRLSSRPNVQNWNKDDVTVWGNAKNPLRYEEDPFGFEKPDSIGSLRSIILPDEDEDWILSCDFEQAQIAIYAFQYGIKWLMQMYAEGHYIHGMVYEDLWKEPFFDRTNWQPGQPLNKTLKLKSATASKLRIAKAVPLGFIFKRQPKAVAEEQGWTYAEGLRLHKWWLSKVNPEMEQSYKQIDYEVKQKGYMKLPNGALVWFPNAKLSDAINSRAQGPEAFIMLGCKLDINTELRRRGLRTRGNRVLLSVHDSISLNVKPNDAEEVYEDIVAPILSRPIPELGGLRLRHEAEMSKMWDWDTTLYEQWKERQRSSRNGHSCNGDAPVRSRERLLPSHPEVDTQLPSSSDGASTAHLANVHLLQDFRGGSS